MLTRMSTRPQRLSASRDHRGDLLGVGDVGAVGERVAARRLDLLDDLQRRLGGRAARAEIVDDDLRAARGEAERMAAPEPAAGAGDDGDAAVKTNAQGVPPVMRSVAA